MSGEVAANADWAEIQDRTSAIIAQAALILIHRVAVLGFISRATT